MADQIVTRQAVFDAVLRELEYELERWAKAIEFPDLMELARERNAEHIKHLKQAYMEAAVV